MPMLHSTPPSPLHSTSFFFFLPIVDLHVCFPSLWPISAISVTRSPEICDLTQTGIRNPMLPTLALHLKDSLSLWIAGAGKGEGGSLSHSSWPHGL